MGTENVFGSKLYLNEHMSIKVWLVTEGGLLSA